MTFVQPAFLWGLLAVAVPILIHFWHQKKGQPMAWAAMEWLREATEQPQRGLKFENALLLALRCLLITLLSVWLAEPVWPDKTNPKDRTAVHIAVADSLVMRTFRFELQQARQRGEPIVTLPSPTNPMRLQTLIDSVHKPHVTLHLYALNEATLADAPVLTTPARFSLHTALLPTRPAATQTRPFASIDGPLNVQLDYRNPTERQTVTAALRALETVFGLRLNMSSTPEGSPAPDWVLTDRLPKNLTDKTLYTVSGQMSGPNKPNVQIVPDTLTPQTATWVANGQLPEWLGEQLLRFYGPRLPDPPLTQAEMARLFEPQAPPKTDASTQSGHSAEQVGVLLALLLVLNLERWIALRKNT
ncbi:BatA domain-containing protein [Rudanella lutea]|uniref:BatA domain-containing protein n=1 Tax=Rudanella lutea TaxID=451374 RepID=UPI000365F979|nr:BatA domain-containing protein [Rudanella lutea]